MTTSLHQTSAVSRHGHTRHWHHLYTKRRRRARMATAGQMGTTQLVSLVGSVIAGVLLDANKSSLAAIVGAFVVLPGVFNICGSLGASLSAKINHRASTTTASMQRIFVTTTAVTFLIAVTSGGILSLTAATVAWWLFDARFWQVAALSMGSITACALIGFPIVGYLSVYVRQRGLDPDDIVGPIESSVFDVLSVIMIALLARSLL